MNKDCNGEEEDMAGTYSDRFEASSLGKRLVFALWIRSE